MTRETNCFAAWTRPAIAATAVTLMLFLGACSGSDPGADSTVTLTVVVKSNLDSPENYGVTPGDVIAGAEVWIRDSASPEAPSMTGTTDDSGRVEFTVTGGMYDISAERATQDPYCNWYGGDSVEVGNSDTEVTLDYLGVACQ